MNLWQRIFGWRENRDRVDARNPKDPVLAAWFGGGGSAANVNADTAMQNSAVYASIALIAETIAALPLHVYQVADGKTSKAYSHPLYPVLHDYSADGLTSYEWREMMVTHTALRGDSFARIVLNGRGQVTALTPLHPDMVRAERGTNGKVRYRFKPATGPEQILLDDEVLRIPFKLMDGVTSLSPIALHRETISTALASKSYLDSFYRNAAQPKGALKFPGALSKEAAAAVRESWERRHQGQENAGRIAILDGGMEFQAIGMTMEDQQYIELQNFSVSDIARIFGVPPHKIGDLSKATFSNIEHQAIEFVTDTVLRWCRRIESRMNWYLLSANERGRGYYIAFDIKGLLRGDAAARSNFYRSMFYIGAMSPNEIRAAEDMNPYEGGDEFFVQGATVPINMAQSNVDGNPDPAPTGARSLQQRQDQSPVQIALSTREIDDAVLRMSEAGAESVRAIGAAAEERMRAIGESMPINITVEPAAPPNVEVTVQAPNVEVTAPSVNVTATMPERMSMSIESMPDRVTTSKLDRDKAGNITKTSQIERDA